MRSIVVALGSVLFAGHAAGQSAPAPYPSKPIRIIVPFTPGGPADMTARPIGQGLTESWGQQVLIDHRAGAGGSIGAETALTLDDCVERIDGCAAAARGVRPDVIVLCHGGPIATPEDAHFILAECPECNGFYGASSMERLPTEVALTQQTKRFVAIRRSESILKSKSLQGSTP